jgi:hypothetical protein
VIDKVPRLLQGFGIILAKQPDETDEWSSGRPSKPDILTFPERRPTAGGCETYFM